MNKKQTMNSVCGRKGVFVTIFLCEYKFVQVRVHESIKKVTLF